MPRSLAIRLVVVLVVALAALFALSRIDSSKPLKPVVVPVPDNALAR